MNNFFSLEAIAFTFLAILVSAMLTTSSIAGDDFIPYTCIYADDNGITHFKEDKFFLYSGYHGDVKTIMQTPMQRAAGFYLFRAIEGWSAEKTTAKRKHFTVILKGEMQISSGDGERRTFKSGDILYLEDMKSHGHNSLNIGQEKLLTLNIALP
jgi:mannose-6-phosphate isomerase-like protein (cupin superfamily)